MDHTATYPPRILIVDDDPSLLEAIPETVRLRIPHAVVESAESAGAALDRVATLDPDVIVTDFVMPGRLESISFLRSEKFGPGRR